MSECKEPIIRWESEEIARKYKNDFNRINEMYPEGMDLECVAICDAINLYPGIKTTSSCCNHGRGKYMIFFESKSNMSLAWILFHVTYGLKNWNVTVDTEGTASEVSYMLIREYTPEETLKCYQESERIAKLLKNVYSSFLLNQPADAEKGDKNE